MKVSVIVPAYNQAAFLGATVRSVLSQTYPNLEIIVVNDRSPDDTDGVIRQFDDPRLKYIVHERNAGLPTSRNTGIRAATGDLVALLDADDRFHREKLAAHVDFYRAHPEVDVTYNARFELNHSADTIREIWRPPPSVGLMDLVLGFPFAPSDTVARRSRLLEVGMFDPAKGSAEDTDLPCRLALAGCRFAGIDRVLNDRRYHSGRGRKNLAGRLSDVRRAIDAVFADPRCPADVRALGARALSHHLMVLVSLALLQNETKLAHEFCDELVRSDPAVLEGRPCELISFLMMESVADDSLDHEELLQRMLAQLPPALTGLASQQNWAVARGHLWKGLRSALWERTDTAAAHLARAAELGAEIDETFVQFVTSHLLNHEMAFGADAALLALDRLAAGLQQVGGRRRARQFKGSYLVNQAFQQFRAGALGDVPRTLARAVANEPAYLANRGVLSMMVRSVIRQDARRG